MIECDEKDPNRCLAQAFTVVHHDCKCMEFRAGIATLPSLCEGFFNALSHLFYAGADDPAEEAGGGKAQGQPKHICAPDYL